MIRLLTSLIAVCSLLASVASADMQLLMGDEDGCYWCEKWTDEIGPIYPKTAEGQIAPLLRHDIHDAIPSGIELKSSLHFTPTFVLLKDGLEVARIDGYPGEDFFWGLLAQMIKTAQVESQS